MESKGVCLVTGAAKGLGYAAAKQLAAQGWSLGINDIDGELLQKLTAEVKEIGAKVCSVQGDVSVAADVDRMVKQTVAELGQIDALLNNAGILHPASVLELTEEAWDRVMDVNLKGCFLVAQAVARHMVDRQIGGRIINMSTINSKIPRWREVAYCASKAGLTHMNRVFALELAQYGITVNTLSPGSIDGGVLWHHFDPAAHDRVVKGDPERFRLGIPLGQLGKMEDVNACIEFLLSPGAKHITGIELFVDGGQSMF